MVNELLVIVVALNELVIAVALIAGSERITAAKSDTTGAAVPSLRSRCLTIQNKEITICRLKKARAAILEDDPR